MWVFYVFIPHVAKKIPDSDLLIMKNVSARDFSDGRIQRVYQCDQYVRNMKNETGEAFNVKAVISSESGEVHVQADTALEDHRKNTCLLSGEVVLSRQDSRLHTSQLIYYQGLDQVIAPHPVRILQPGQVISGNSLEFYPKTERWYLKGNVVIRLMEHK